MVLSYNSCSVIFYIVAVFLDHVSEFCHSGIVLKPLPDSRVYAIEILFNFKSKGMKNLNFSLKGPTTFKIFRIETLLIANYENVPTFVFDWLAVKLWLKESTIFWNDFE